MKLIFIIDQIYDTNLILSMLKITPPEQLTKKAKEWGINIGLTQEIKKDEINKAGNLRYQKLGGFLPQVKNWYQQSWDEINNEFFENVEEITGHQWKHQNYECVVSLFHRGISNWGGNKIVRGWDENPHKQRRITAHELLISHYFTIIRDFFPQENLTDNQIWQLAEIAAFALTGLEERITRFWPWDETGYYTNHNYSQLIDLQLKLRERFLKRQSFDEYIQIGIEEIKKGDYSDFKKK